MATTDTAPNLTNNPALVRALVALLISQPNRPTIAIAAADQEYTRAACRRAIAEALRTYARQFPTLIDRYPNLADFTKYSNETKLLEDAWLVVNEFISAQLPERNLPTREQLEYWMNQQELDRLERLAANPNPKSPWRAETLTLEQMQQLIARARAWDETRLGIQEAATNALVNDLPPRAQALAIESQAIQALTDIPAAAASQEVAADLQTGTRFDRAESQRITSILGNLSHPASAATTVATASAAGRSTFRQGVTQALQAPLSHEAIGLSHSLQTAGVEGHLTRQVLDRFEDAVGQGQDHTAALRTALRGVSVSPREAERIVSAAGGSAQEYHRLVKEVGTQVDQLRQAGPTRQQLARAAAPSARQLVHQIQTATGVSQERASRAWAVFEANVRYGPRVALERSLAELDLPPAKIEATKVSLAPTADTYGTLIQEGKTQAAAQQFTNQVRAATGVDQVEATKILSTLEQRVAQNQPHQTAVAESLAGKLAEPETPETLQKAYAALAPAVEDYVTASQGVRAQPISAEVARPIAERFTQQIQTATGASPEQANQTRVAFEEGLTQGKTPGAALTESLNTLPLSPEQAQQAVERLQGPANVYEPFVQQDKTQVAVAQASPVAQEQFVQHLATSANLSRLQAVQISLRFEQAVRLGQDPATALRSSLSDPNLGLSPDQLEQLSTNLTPFAQEYATLLQVSPVAQAGLAPTLTSTIPLMTVHALNERSLADQGPVITHTALELHQLGVRNDTLARQLARSPHQAEFNPEFLRQTQEALEWLEQHPEALQEFGLATPTPLEQFVLEMDSRPRGSTEYFRRRFELLNQQLNTRNAQGLSGWLKAPGLKWQTGWSKFAADHAKLTGFASFISSPKAFVTNKVGGWLAGKGLRWLTKSAAGKAIGGLLTKVGGKLAGKGLAKLLGGAVGTLIGGPIGTVVGIALGFILEKVGGWLLKNLKKIAIVLGALLALLIGLLAKLAAVLPALLTGLGLYVLPFNPLVGSLMLGSGLLGLAKQAGAWLGKGGISNLLGGLGTSIGNFLGLSTAATVPTYVMAAPFVAVGGLVAVSVFSSIALSSAFVLPPSEEQKLEIAIDPRTGKPLGCTTGSFPLPGTNSASSPIARRAWEIVNNLQQGFWCYWNNSPDYPELFNLSLYQTSPFPTYPGEINQCADCLFWCTWLVQKAYGGGIPNALGARAMMESWPNPLTSPDKATPTNIQPGSVIFFETSSGSPGVNHVAIVYSVSDDSVVYVQSNSPAKRGSLTFNDSGVGVQSLPGIKVVNFGAP